MSNVIDNIYKQRSGFVIIGLTGRTGSGCSTIANYLQQKSFEEFNAPEPNKGGKLSNEDRKYKITYTYLKENWQNFITINVSDIITFFVLQHTFKEFRSFFSSKKEEVFDSDFKKKYEELHLIALKVMEYLKQKRSRFNIDNILSNYKKELKELQSDLNEKRKEITKRTKAEKSLVNKFLFTQLNKFTEDLKQILQNNKCQKTYYEFQIWGDNIRIYGKAIPSEKEKINKIFTPSKLAEEINLIIKFIRDYFPNKEKTCIVIDALRNPYEVLFFRERYSAFYLMSINTEEIDRKNRLTKLGLTIEEINKLDKKEYKDRGILLEAFGNQNLQRCIELSDIHVHNPNHKGKDNHYLKRQLVHYLSLMIHPGLVPPTQIERSMQFAYTAKLNSGCLSRQVGAAITDDSYVLKSVGWNTTPQGQTPCILRNFFDLIKSNDQDTFSTYELTNKEFRNSVKYVYDKYESRNSDKMSVKEQLKGRNLSYCFKDLKNLTDKEKNQVHTRSLHAEENAFLQISKYGGVRLKGGKLFTTASPCELCAKKAYQIGIKEIYYIDPYPGISLTHILDNGINKPEMILFKGAIGRAYYHLYHPILSYKDEIYDILGYNYKENFQEIKRLEDLEHILAEQLKQNLNIKIQNKIKEIYDLISKQKQNK